MYVSYIVDKDTSTLKVVERVNGQRQYREFPLILEYYVPSETGRYRGYDGVRLDRQGFKNLQMFYNCKNNAIKNGVKTYEANFNLANKVLYERYSSSDVPVLHKSFIDIECDRLGHENTTIKEMIEDANCPINAVSIYNNWEDRLYTLMLCPENLTIDEAREIAGRYENTFVFIDEKDLLNSLILVLNDADCISSWNGVAFDYPYIVRRIRAVLGKEKTKELCLFGEEPLEKIITEQGQQHYEYTFSGKWLSDYLLLYKKHQTSVKESYKLDAIAEFELGDKKIDYSGLLDDLYRDDYGRFILYNRQDTMLVKRLEDKMQYIEIHNRQAHAIRCSLENTMGTVAWVDQAIINKAHDLGMKVPDVDLSKNKEYENIIPPGAYVASPKEPLVEHVFSYDINSLYPNTCIAINISPETIVAQIKLEKTLPYLQKKIKDNDLWSKKTEQVPDWGKAWGGDDLWGTLEYQAVMNQTDDVLTLKLEKDGREVQLTAKQIYELVFNENSNLSISGLGTLYRTDVDGLIPTIFTEWYIERKKQKAKKEKYQEMLSGVSITDEEFLKQLRQKLE